MKKVTSIKYTGALIYKIILFALFFLFLNLHIFGEPNQKNAHLQFAIKFLNNLQNKKLTTIKASICPTIPLNMLSKKDILDLSDKMMLEEISIYEYLKKISGHNIQQFLNQKLTLLKIGTLQEYGKDNGKTDNNETVQFYYLKFKLSYKNGEKAYKKSIEIDILEKKNNYLVCGFII